MWVEISWSDRWLKARTSSSSWGCELKYQSGTARRGKLHRHPLREDVSWNISRWGGEILYDVILFVRMWVEIRFVMRLPTMIASSSSWGCELKYNGHTMTEKKLLSSSSWGCELKCTLHSLHYTLHGHPLREDVSWNALLPLIHSALIQSSSSWGCELKWIIHESSWI